MENRYARKVRIAAIFAIVGLIAAAVWGFRSSSASSNAWTGYANMDWYRDQPVDPGFTIRTAAELAGVANLVNSGEANGFEGKTLMINNDINLAGHDWVPIGTQEHPFRGTLISNGGNVRIEGLTLKDSFSHVGLFGKAVDASIGGFTIGSSGTYNITVTQEVYAGSVVGEMSGLTEVHHVINELNMLVNAGSHKAYVGGIAGFGEYKISNSTNQAQIQAVGHGYVGGIFGVSSAKGLLLKKVDNHGQVVADGESTYNIHAGGIAGMIEGPLDMAEDNTPIVNTGEIRVIEGQHNYAGGMFGELASSSIAYSGNTINAGAVIVEAPNGASSSAGGFIGAVTVPQLDAVDILFVNTGSVANQGGNHVYTGGIAGLVQAGWHWTGDVANDAPVSARGIENVYTAGLIGKTTGDISFAGEANNRANGTISVMPDLLGNKPNETYTGGLIGYSDQRIFLENTTAGAYGNNASIQVSGGNGLYTGGIVSNRAYTSAAGSPSNVSSSGAITVEGESKLYTGGFIGMLTGEAADQGMQQAAFFSDITVNAATSMADQVVATGGIIGFYENNGVPSALDGLKFRGNVRVSGGKHSYTGGIAGYATDVSTVDAEVGQLPGTYASIASDGHLGGVAGYASGSIVGARVSYVTLEATNQGSDAGGIAGIAQGSIIDATVGDAAGNTQDSVRFTTDMTDTSIGEVQYTGGGIVGANEGSLHIGGNSRVDKIVLLTATEQSHYTFGGIAGSLTAEARLGEALTPLHVQDVHLTISANQSEIGGAIGRNGAVELYVNTENITLEALGDDLVIGGVIGQNGAHIGEGTSKMLTLNVALQASGSNAIVGGVAGHNSGTLLNGVAQDGILTITGALNTAGGVVGRNTGTLLDLNAVNMRILAQAQGAVAGGIVGRSERALGIDVNPSIKNVHVEQQTAPLMMATQSQVYAGGIVGYAQDTQIIMPVVTALLPDSVLMTAAEPAVRMGGIAGMMVNGSVSGDGLQANVENLLIVLGEGTEGSYAGGIVGYSDNTALDQLVLKTGVLTLKGEDSLVGGALGFHRGSETAIISNVYLEGISLKAMPSASGAKVGGLVGWNEQRAGIDPVQDPKNSVSTLQNNRVIGNLANPTAPIIDIRAPFAIAGGLVAENHALVANNSSMDQIAISVKSEGSTVGGHTGINGLTGTLFNTYANAKLTTVGQGIAVGGLVGLNQGHVISSYVDTELVSESSGIANQWAPIGGLVGRNQGEIETSYSASKVTAKGVFSTVGGLVGVQESGSIRHSYAGKNVAATANNAYAGGFAGRIVDGSIAQSYSAANVTAANGAYAGGFAGRYDNESKALLTKNYYLKDEAVNLNKDLPDFAEGNHRWLNVPSRLSTLLASTLRDRTAFPALSGWDFANLWRYGSLGSDYLYPELIRSANSSGGGVANVDVAWYTHDTSSIIYEIDTEAKLSGLAAIVNGDLLAVDRFDFAGREIRITNPIHIQSSEWIPIGKNESSPFQGTFKGNSHLIDGYTLSANAAHNFAGLFGVIGTTGKVENVKVEPLSIEGTDQAGALAAVNRGKVIDAQVYLGEGTRISGSTVGGVLGINRGVISGIKLGTASGAIIEVTVDNGTAGGLIGDNLSEIDSQSIVGLDYPVTVTSSVPNAILGGVIGRQSGNFTQMEIPMGMKIQSDGVNAILGGIVGQYDSGRLADIEVLFSGSVEARGSSSVAGGVIGRSNPDHQMNNITVTGMYTAAIVHGNGTVGGVIGEKLGSGTNVIELQQLRVSELEIGTFDSGTHTVIGGIVGRLADSILKDALFEGHLKPQGQSATVGGIAGAMSDSLLYRGEANQNIEYDARSGLSIIGGIVGKSSASDPNQSYSLGATIPFYVGLYEVQAHGSSLIKSTQDGAAAEVMAGGLVGMNDRASIYFAEASVDLEIDGFSSATVGGIAGHSTGNLIQTKTSGTILAKHNTSIQVGGAVGWVGGGEIHDTHVQSSSATAIIVQETVKRLPALPEVYAGGFAGVLNQAVLTNVTTAVSLQVTSRNLEDSLYVGGFAGIMGNDAGAADGEVDRAYAQGTVQVDGRTTAIVGGFAGSINRYFIQNSYASGDVINAGFDTRTGGFAGSIERRAVIHDAYATQSNIRAKGVNEATRAYAAGFAAYLEGHLEDVYAHASSITIDADGASAYSGALVGYLFRDGTITKAAYSADLNPIGYSLGTTDQLVRENRLGALKLDDWYLFADAAFLLDEGIEFHIRNEDQLFASVRLSNASTGLRYLRLFDRSASLQLNRNIRIGADLNLAGLPWTPYESFTAVFDGQEHRIQGLSLDSTSENVGFMKEVAGTIRNVRFAGASVSGPATAQVGVLAGTLLAGGLIEHAEVDGTVDGGAATGMIAGVNSGKITDTNASGSVTGALASGGIAGVNAGEIHQSYTASEVHGIVSGGIVGNHQAGGWVHTVFSYGDVNAVGTEVAAGGIAGITNGRIETSYASGRIEASGSQRARAGGIAGLAESGIILKAMNFGEVTSTVNGKVSKGNSFFGGIAGQKLELADIESGVFNRQMLRGNVAFYNQEGNQVHANATAVQGMTTAELAMGMLPDAFDSLDWNRTTGFFPQLSWFAGQAASRLSSAAILLETNKQVYQTGRSLQATLHPDVTWSSDGVRFRLANQVLAGELIREGAIDITVAVSDLHRKITINAAAPEYERQAATPSFVQPPHNFKDKVMVELLAGEPAGIVYYTLDGTLPGPESFVYGGPIELNQTTMIQAITIVEDVGPSEVLKGKWVKESPGGGFIPSPPSFPSPPVVAKPAVEVFMGDVKLPNTPEEPLTLARNTRLTLRVMEGTTVYYTLDGTIPTKNSPIYNSDLLITKNMSIKLLTDPDGNIVTLDFKVQPAEFSLKPEAAEIRYMSGYKNRRFEPNQAITRYELISGLAHLLNIQDIPLGTLLRDVDATKEDIVSKFESTGLITGYPDGTFGGSKGLTRAEMIVILTRMLKLNLPPTSQTAFPDTKKHWSNPYVVAFKKAGYIHGYPDGTFRPDQPISRAEAVVIINNLLGMKPTSDHENMITFIDLAPNYWAYKAIMSAARP